jgi:endonuclease/exonuclease/phosphatase family metal-dependent hydrolase
MRFASFNISSGRSPADGLIDLDRFAGAIAALDADVLSLQEVDRGQERSDGADLTELAAEAMGAPYRTFAPALYGTPGRRWTVAEDDQPRTGPAYGCALISRLPLHDVTMVRMPAAPIVLPLWVPGHGIVPVHEEPRVAVVAHVDIGTPLGLTVVGTHLPFVPLWNRRQLRHLVERTRNRSGPLLLMGDLNLHGRTPERLTGFTSLATAPTFPAAAPRFQLDHILLRGRLADLGTVVSTSTPQLAMSDHRPLVVDVELAG